jgi:hypothetical protein
MRGLTCALTVSAGVLAGVTAQAEPTESLAVRLVAINRADVPDIALKQAEHHAARIFSAAGIALRWAHTRPDEPYPGPGPHVRIIIVPDSRMERDRRRVGAALRGTIDAYVFASRVADRAAHARVDIAIFLGHVIAHEIGHLLLPYGSHSLHGVMRAEWDRAHGDDMLKGRLLFASGQADLIRTRVRGLSGVASRR